jgi:hypothetical protein
MIREWGLLEGLAWCRWFDAHRQQCLRSVGAATISRTHGQSVSDFRTPILQGVPGCRSRGRVLDSHCRWASFPRRVGPGRCGEHRARSCRNWAGDGGAGFADCFCSHVAISYGIGGKAGATSDRAGSRKFSQRRPGIFHIRRFGSYRDRDQAGASISFGARIYEALPRDFTPPELSRQHLGGDVGQRQRGSPRALRAVACAVGTRGAVLLLSLPV